MAFGSSYFILYIEWLILQLMRFAVSSLYSAIKCNAVSLAQLDCSIYRIPQQILNYQILETPEFGLFVYTPP